MKTTIKLGLCAAAFLLMFAGCSNAVKPSTVADDSFRANVTGTSHSTTEALTVSSVTPAPVKYGDADNKYLIEVTFSKPVTDSVKNAIEFYPLTPSKDADKAPTKGNKLSAEITVNGKVARCVVTGKDVYLWMKITGSAVEAVNGQRLNLDGDTEWGEPDDDDYVVYTKKSGFNNFKLGNPTETLGRTYYLNTGNDNVVYNGWLTPKFKKASEEKDSSNKPVHPELGDLVNKIEISWATGVNIADYGVKADAITPIIKDHLRVEQYVNGKWQEISSDGVKFSDYNTTDKKWSASLTLNSDTQVRYKWVDLQNMPNLTSDKYKYPIKFTMECNPKGIVAAGSAEPTNRKASAFAPWDPTVVLSNRIWSDDHVEFELKGDTFTQNVYISDKLQSASVTPKKKDGYYLDFTGFVGAGLKEENFKVVFAGKQTGTYTKADISKAGDIELSSSVTLKLNNTFVAKEAKVTELVKSCSDVGSYPKATNNKVTLYFRPVAFPTEAQVAASFIAQLSALDENSYGAADSIVKTFYDTVFAKLKYQYKLTEERKAATVRFVKAVVDDIINNGADSIKGSIILNVNTPLTKTLYISSEVKAAGFTGTYKDPNDGNKDKDYNNVPALGFKVSEPSSDPLKQAGWVQLN